MRRTIAVVIIVVTLSGSVQASDPPPLPADLMRHTRTICAEYSVPVPLVLAIMECESGFDPDAVSADGTCFGLMQIHRCNAAWVKSCLGVSIYDPKGGITAGVYILAEYLSRYDLHRALMAYNSGEGGARRLWEQGVTETAYSRRVAAGMERWVGYAEVMPRVQRPREGGMTE